MVIATAQKLQQSTASLSGSSYTSCKANMALSEQFPAGLRVLVVDDDTTCLKILEQMLRRCLYTVTLCSEATAALKLLRERKGGFDVVLSDVHMPDMDGYKLLEHVGLEMDLPVIMMSADGSTSAVMRGIKHGACDYLIKPIREEELKNIWQHVVRKKWNENKDLEHSGSLDNSDLQKLGNDDSCYASSVVEGSEEALRGQKHKRDSKEDDDSELENADPSSSKKPRVVWSVELHQQFVNAVNQLGLDKAVPKRILELMNVPGLTRENVASHLQKFRLYLKRLSGVVAQQGGISHPFCGPGEPNMKYASLGRFDIQALAASGQIPSQTLAALHAELLGQPVGNLSLPKTEQPAAVQAFLQSSNPGLADQGASSVQHSAKCQPDASKSQTLISNEDVHSGFGAWPSDNLRSTTPGRSPGGSNTQDASLFADIVRKQHQQQPLLADSNQQIMVQPSCLVVPSQSSADFLIGNRVGYINQACNFPGSPFTDNNILNQSSCYLFDVQQHSDRDLKEAVGNLDGYAAQSSLPSISCCSINVDEGNGKPFPVTTMTFGGTLQQPEFDHRTCNLQGSYSAKVDKRLDPGSLNNVGKLSSFPSRFAVEMDQAPVVLSHKKISDVTNETRIKPEPGLDCVENARLGIPVLTQYPSSGLMHVVSK